MNKYEEEKMKWDQAFNRCLSDREFAEGLLDQLDKAKEENDDLLSERDELTEALSKESKKPTVDDRWLDLIDKLEVILSAPAKKHFITVRIDDDKTTIDCILEGMFDEDTCEDEETLSE